MNTPDLEEKIIRIKNKIADIRSSIATEKCNYKLQYIELETLEKELQILINEQERLI